MFTHGKTGQKYYSVREKINYYKKIISGKITDVPVSTKRKAKARLKSLEKINNQSYNEPRLIVTDDKHFDHKMSKPRLAVAYGENAKGNIFVVPIYERAGETKTIVFDKNINRQASVNSHGKARYLDKSDVYEQKYVSKDFNLTKYDKAKIKEIFKK